MPTPLSVSDPNWPSAVTRFWFEDLGRDNWFVKDTAIDARITDTFLPLYDALKSQEPDLKAAKPLETLALILVFDQFPRNMFRDTPQAFETDVLALRLAKNAIAQGVDARLSDDERMFLYMPFQHSEDIEDQRRSIELYTALGQDGTLDYARRHLRVIEEFGRFPHRNAILGRQSTEDEAAYLAQPGAGF